jgi:hypothetical protein
MIWFGSSAGVAIATMYPEARDAGKWLRHGWFVTVAYVVGFFVLLGVMGFQPGSTPRGSVAPAPVPAATVPSPARMP